MSVRALRQRAGVTQAALASAAGTSQPTIAAYEAGRKSPTLRTLRRLARSVGLDVFIAYPDRALSDLTREERRSLALHRAIAARFIAQPEEVLGRALRNVAFMRARHPGARRVLDEWAEILQRPRADVVEAILDPSAGGRERRHLTPFAGVLSAGERADVYRAFRAREAA